VAHENSLGQAELGSCIEKGDCGLEKDDTEMLRLYKASAAQYNGAGLASLANCYKKGHCGVDQDDQKASELLELSAKEGHDYGVIAVGNKLEKGFFSCAMHPKCMRGEIRRLSIEDNPNLHDASKLKVLKGMLTVYEWFGLEEWDSA
jgi:TPR repeat protein